MIPGIHILFLSAVLFGVGLVLIISKRNAIMVLLGIELLFNASNLNIVLFGNYRGNANAELFAVFIIVVAVCEAAVGLAIILRVYHYYHTIAPDEVNQIGEK